MNEFINNNIDKLIDLWADWEKFENYYLTELIPKLKNDFSSASDEEKVILCNIKNNSTLDEWEQLEEKVKDRYKNKLKKDKLKAFLNKIEQLLLQNKYLQAINLFNAQENLGSDFDNDFQILLDKYLSKYIKNQKNTLKKLLSSGKKAEAKNIFYECMKVIPQNKQLEFGDFYETQEERYQKCSEIISCLSKYDFLKADSMYKEVYTDQEYYEVKSEYVLSFFKKILKHNNIDKEKAFAIAQEDKNVLLKARAGSGKTTTICSRVKFLTEKYNIDTEEMMILAFNTDVAEKLKYDLKRDYGLEYFENARTFHSLARNIYPKGNIVQEEHFKRYIQEACGSLLSKPEFYKKLYSHFRKEFNEADRYGISLPPEEYINFRKNLEKEITLNAEYVKSWGEKYIADFLLEHNIEYTYEKTYYIKPEDRVDSDIDLKVYRPDFYIRHDGKEYILEHWAMSEKDETIIDPAYEDIPREEYISNMHKKRRYWKSKGIQLIETYYQKGLSREEFEANLKSTLESYGFKSLKKLDVSSCYRKIKDINKPQIINMLAGFIQSSKKSLMSIEDIREQISQSGLSERNKLFVELALPIYLDYEKKLNETNSIDFNDLIVKATEIIIETEGNCEINVGNNKKIKVKDLKYIMIDEYQDFSKLFFHLIKAIQKFNPNVNIFCVGDDWQAINGFAGSNLYYFKNFENLFDNSVTCDLRTNYRSKSKIVEYSNKLMAGEGKDSKYLESQKGGLIAKCNVSRTYVNQSDYNDKAYLFDVDSSNIKAKYLKTCIELIKDNIEENPELSVMILCRTNQLLKTRLKGRDSAFSKKLLRTLNLKNNIKIEEYDSGSIHKFKGLQADIVIVLRASDGLLPLIHPNFELDMIFNKTLKDILDEEKRLFYVAMTRAKNKLYLLTEEKQESKYISSLEIPQLVHTKSGFKFQYGYNLSKA